VGQKLTIITDYVTSGLSFILIKQFGSKRRIRPDWDRRRSWARSSCLWTWGCTSSRRGWTSGRGGSGPRKCRKWSGGGSRRGRRCGTRVGRRFRVWQLSFPGKGQARENLNRILARISPPPHLCRTTGKNVQYWHCTQFTSFVWWLFCYLWHICILKRGV